MEIKAESKGDTLFLYARGDLDEYTATSVRRVADEYIRDFASKPNAKKVIFYLHEVSFMDSSGIAVVIHAMRQMSQIEGRLLLSGLNSQPLKVFRASGIDKLIEIKEASV